MCACRAGVSRLSRELPWSLSYAPRRGSERPDGGGARWRVEASGWVPGGGVARETVAAALRFAYTGSRACVPGGGGEDDGGDDDDARARARDAG